MAYLGALWASVCFFGHGFTNHTDIIDKFGNIGQNIWLGPYNPGVIEVVSGWHDEVGNYNYATGECNGVCGHYTQVY